MIYCKYLYKYNYFIFMLLTKKSDLDMAAISKDANASVASSAPMADVSALQDENSDPAPEHSLNMQHSTVNLFPERSETQPSPISRVTEKKEVYRPKEGEDFTPTNWLNEVFVESFRLNASDIHIIPEKEYTSVRFRVDGIISEVAKWDINYHEMVLSRIKIISGLQVVEKNIPQDGHLEILFGQTKEETAEQKGATSLNFRVSTMPTINGEAAVLRVLSKENSVLGLDKLGLSDRALSILRKILQKGHGLVLITGYSGSGKTTTLYSALNEINAAQKVIMTLEDPVEYRVPMIQQSQVNLQTGYTFEAGLKAILRQDPDVIMIGEIRDDETANIAMRLAMVGRLVLSTLHTDSIAGALTRVMDMGISKSIISSAFMGVVAERLVRKICPNCREESTPPYELMKTFNIEWPADQKVYAGRGCDTCEHTGFLNRTGIFEVLEFDSEFVNILLSDISTKALDEYVKSHVTETLREDGFEKVRKGVTTLEEVIRATI